MNRDVLVSVKGLFLAPTQADEENIEVVAPGEYFERGDAHYIAYEEHSTDFEEPVRNLIKIGEDRVELRKRGLISTDMVFSKDAENMSHYTTPFGSLIMGIRASEIIIDEQPGSLSIKMTYSLEINYEHSSDCNIEINIRNRENGQ